MGTLAAYWKGGTKQMPGPSVQRITSRSVIDGQVNVDFGYHHISHNSSTTQIQLVNIIFRSCENGFLRVGFLHVAVAEHPGQLTEHPRIGIAGKYWHLHHHCILFNALVHLFAEVLQLEIQHILAHPNGKLQRLARQFPAIKQE